MNALVVNRNADGGFGNEPGDASSVLDTAYALEALAIAKASGSIVASAAGYLLNNQTAAGGWSDGENDASVYLTAQTMRALWHYRHTYVGVSTALTSAQNFLLSQRDGNGLWGEHFNTSLVLLALIPAVADPSVLASSLTALQAAQLPDGSWLDDPYTTALALRALYAATQPTPNPTLGAVSGQVTDSTTGTPLMGVTVTVMGTVTRSAVTGADGSYVVTDVPPGPVSLMASLSGYLTVNASGIVASGQALTFNPRLAKDPQPVPITVRGLVVRKDTGAPLSGVTVSVVNTRFTAQTAADGRFEIDGIPAGSIQLAIQLSGFLSASYVVSAPSGGLMDLGSIALDSGTPNTTTGSVQGSVIDALASQPLRNVAVSLSGADSRTVLTDINGRFALANVNPGSVNIAATLDGYQTAAGSGTVAAGNTLLFSVRLVKLSNPALTTVTGSVVDAATRTPLPGVAVHVANTVFSAVTGADGSFQIGNVPTGPITVTLSLTGYTPLAYTVSAPNGGLVMLGTVAMAANVPITGNHNPIISSHAPTLAVAGQPYVYIVQATDPDGDALTYGLATYPSGMTIDPTSGQVKWTPTLTQAGPQTFTVVVFDTQGGSAQEIVNVNVSTGGSRSYVVTDVQTLSGLYVNSVVPNNYALGSYVSGGRPGFVVGSPACPLSWFPAGSDVAGALSKLERLTGPNSLGAQPSSGNDIIMDMGQTFSSITVFPQIDHDPFPNEGIEYTVWGSNDPNAVFPDGWRLATLVSIYRQGYVQTPSCGGQNETDDYAGLYTFGLNSYRYVRVRADYSITIFNTPDHTTWSGTFDDSGEPGWQSSEAEIDAVGGMVCDVKPTANAGPDIVGLTGQVIQFNGSASQGNILTYGWDINGDGVIDLTGPSPSYVFTGEVDRDVTLMVVDNRGCVGTSTTHVTIGLNLPRPDLTVNQVEAAAVITDPQTLRGTGSAHVVIQNIGQVAAPTPALVTVFEDTNHNGVFDAGVDNVLGSLTMPSGLARGASLSMDVPINGTMSFRDDVIYAMVNSDRQIAEARYDNNVGFTTSACQAPPTVRSFNPVVKFQALRGVNVISTPIVAPLQDTNGDGKFDQNDIPAVVVPTMPNGQFNGGPLKAFSGDDGHELFTTPNNALVATLSELAVADIDGDGKPEIIAAAADGRHLIAFTNTGAIKWISDDHPLPGRIDSGGAISIANLDGDTKIVIGASVYSSTGRLLGDGRALGGTIGFNSYSAISAVADINLDGIPEIVAGPSAYQYANGQLKLLWHNTNVLDGFIGIANFNADPYPEIVVVGNGSVYLLDHAGALIWGPVALPGGGPGGAPTIGDFDGDGQPEIGVAGANQYTVFKGDGSVLWSSPTQDLSSGTTGSTSFDFVGDGKAEIVYRDEVYLRVYNGADGKVLFQMPVQSGTATESPVVADVDGDGHAEIIVPSDRLFGGDINGAGVFVIKDAANSWVPTRRIWNQHSFHITNINDDGVVPKVEQNSWQVHNTYRLNAFLDRPRATVVDLSASLLRLTDLGSGQLRLSVRIGNGGSAASPSTTVAFYDGDPNQGGVLLGSAPVSALQPGQYQDATLDGAIRLSGQNDVYAVVDPTNQISECRKDNNRVSGPATVQSLTGSIAVTTDAPVYGPQAPVNVTATIANASALPATFNAAIRIEDSSGVVLATFPTRSLGTLDGEASVALSETWNTGSYLAGAYRARAQLFSVDGGTLLNEAQAGFSIGGDVTGTVPSVTLRVTTDRPVYNTIDQVSIESLVSNLTTNVLVGQAVLRLTILDAAGATVFTQDSALGQLLPGALRDVRQPYSLNGATVATYRVLGQLIDASTQTVLASAQTSFDVRVDLNKSLSGAVTVALPTLEIGTVQSCTHTLSNVGNLTAAGLEVHYALVNIDTSQLVSDETRTLTLAAGAAPDSYVRSLPTGSLPQGNYACVLQVRIDGSLKTLAFAPFKLVPPPIRIDADLTLGTHGRLLVLLDNGRHGEDEDTDSNDDHGDHSDADHQSDTPSCDGVKQLSLAASFAAPLSSAATVTATVTGHDGVFVDSESANLAGFPGAINLSAGSNGADLVLSQLTAQGIELTLQPLAGFQKLGDEYSVEVTVQDGNTLRLASGTIHTDCHLPLHQGQTLGGFTLNGLDVVPAANDAHYRDGDPHGPAAAPGLKAQRAFLETLLKAKGWSYTITDTAKDFTKELRTGGYAVYAVFAEQEKLDEQAQKELREAVFRGDGLLVAGIHDARNHKILDALGIKLIGRVLANGVDLTASGLDLGGHIDIIPGDQALRIKRFHADTAGLYTVSTPQVRSGQDDCHDQGASYDTNTSTDNARQDQNKDGKDDDECGGHPERYLDAVTTNAYGKGQSVFAGFDLLASATQDGQDSLAAKLLAKALEQVHPAELPHGPGDVVPLTLTLTNRGIATPASATIGLPAGTSVVDPGMGTANAGALVFNVNLAVGEIQHLTFWVKLPPPAGPVTFQAVVTAPTLAQPAATVSYTVTVVQPESLTGIDDRLTQLIHDGASNTEALRRAKDYVDKGLKNIIPSESIEELLKATDALRGIDDPSVTDIRIAIDVWIRWAAQYAF
ncbi:MAG: carboxypeptidase-like regulatory domain-containing protein [Sulfuricaulis sp.]